MSTEILDYRITETLFSNGRTHIARAIRKEDGQSVILKQLQDDFPEAGQLSRFSFSYDVLRRFDHPNICKALAWVKSEAAPTMVLEDIQGVDLIHYLRTFPEQQLPLEIFLNIAVQLAEALSVIHHSQVIHKDLHPGNVVVNSATGQVQIIDFGLASLLSREQPALEAPEKLEGVLAYISPEQTGRMNRAVDYRTDFYTLGVTFYQLLTGSLPFEAEDALGMVHAHIAKTQVSACEVRTDIPEILSSMINKLLNKTAEERYQSALGLKKDLEKCKLAIVRNLPFPEFPLGMEDISDRFQVPQKLYGREAEVALLMKRYFKAAGGKPQMLTVSGYSGMGKSALVHEVHKPIASHNGLFISGKFDQFQKNVPYSALQTALKGWIQQTLSLSEQKLTEKRQRLKAALGFNARVLIDFMPDFEAVFEKLPEVAKLGADETQNRFHLVFQQFIKLITHERPMVIFIDDIQWADRGTLNLLPLLMSEAGCRLLLIVAYRNNEVEDSHPAMQTLEKIRQAPASAGQLSDIALAPLQKTQVVQLLMDALFRSASEIASLAELVHAKTAGNPFFITEFLKTLYTEGLLNFDLSAQRWCWSVDDINAKGITDNVVELMLGKMEQLPASTQALIQLAACIGSRFNLEMLTLIAEQSMAEVTQLLWPALQEGLLLQDGGDWFLGVVPQLPESGSNRSSEGLLRTQSSPVSPQCRFLHDRMLQAAYESMSEDDRQKTHLRVGRLLLHSHRNGLTDDTRFAIVEQLNQGRSLMDDAFELQELVDLNLQAAQRSMEACVWQAAVDYSAVGIELLPADAWISRYDVICHLYHIKAESEYLSANPQASDELYRILFDHLHEEAVKAEICASRLTQCIGRGHWLQGIEFGMQGLGHLGMLIPQEEELQAALVVENATLMPCLNRGVIDNILDLPEMTDSKQLLALKILANLSLNSHILGKTVLSEYCTIKGCNLILRYGKSDLAAIQIGCYALHLRLNNRLEPAYRQGLLAKQLADSYPRCREIANCYNILASMIWYLKSSFADCIALNKKGIQLGLENGEIARAGINLCNSLFASLSQGESLVKIHDRALQINDYLIKVNVFHPLGEFAGKFSAALIDGKQDASHALDDHCFQLFFIEKVKPSFHFSYLHHCRAQLAFWCDDIEYALIHARETQKQWYRLPKGTYVVDHLLLYGVLLARLGQRLTSEDRSQLTWCIHNLTEYSDLYAPNFAHKTLLLQAEILRYERGPMNDACACYRDAIESAKVNGFLQYQALGCELFGEYWLAQGFDELAEPFIREALYLYRNWGCMVKVTHLRETYGDLLAIAEKRTQRSFSRSETVDSQETQALDMASVMKSALVISSELDLKKLAAKVLQVIVECAGATSAALVIVGESGANVEAIVGQNDQLDIPEPPPRLEDYRKLPRNIVSYVLHSDQTVNLGDVIGERAFMDDPYIVAHQPKSVLCMPVDYRDETIGALYLENNLSTNTFTPDRLGVINLLLAQAAISFENARLFTEVTRLNQTLERKVENRTKDLALANDRLSQVVGELQMANEELNTFSYSVSHDLRSPLRSMKGFSQILLDDYSHCLDAAGVSLVQRTIKSSLKMTDLIDGLLELSRLQRRQLSLQKVDISGMAKELFEEMQDRFPEQKVTAVCNSACVVMADKRMLYSLLENLINNAWKYSSKKAQAVVEFGCMHVGCADIPVGVGVAPKTLDPSTAIFYVKDNGDGFDMGHAEKLFGSFARLHSEKQFSGTGIGLATVKRIVEKHGGNIWAQATKDEGATFYFTLLTSPEVSDSDS